MRVGPHHHHLHHVVTRSTHQFKDVDGHPMVQQQIDTIHVAVGSSPVERCCGRVLVNAAAHMSATRHINSRVASASTAEQPHGTHTHRRRTNPHTPPLRSRLPACAAESIPTHRRLPASPPPWPAWRCFDPWHPTQLKVAYPRGQQRGETNVTHTCTGFVPRPTPGGRLGAGGCRGRGNDQGGVAQSCEAVGSTCISSGSDACTHTFCLSHKLFGW